MTIYMVVQEKMSFLEMRDCQKEKSLKEKVMNQQAMIICRVMRAMTICMEAKVMILTLLKIKTLFMMLMGVVKYGLLKNRAKTYLKKKSTVTKLKNSFLMKIIKMRRHG